MGLRTTKRGPLRRTLPPPSARAALRGAQLGPRVWRTTADWARAQERWGDPQVFLLEQRARVQEQAGEHGLQPGGVPRTRAQGTRQTLQRTGIASRATPDHFFSLRAIRASISSAAAASFSETFRSPPAARRSVSGPTSSFHNFRRRSISASILRPMFSKLAMRAPFSCSKRLAARVPHPRAIL